MLAIVRQDVDIMIMDTNGCEVLRVANTFNISENVSRNIHNTFNLLPRLSTNFVVHTTDCFNVFISRFRGSVYS